MSPSTTDLELDILDLQEQEAILPAFNADIAWEIGSIIRRRAQRHSSAVVINITSVADQTFFHALSRAGSNLDNQSWIQRKRRTVNHFGRSSFYMGCKLRSQGKTIENGFFLSEKEYSTQGGAFPIRVRGTEGIVAVIVVSGLRQDLDHALIYDSLMEFIHSYNRQQQQQQQQQQQHHHHHQQQHQQSNSQVTTPIIGQDIQSEFEIVTGIASVSMVDLGVSYA